jgi:hypothetical protein
MLISHHKTEGAMTRSVDMMSEGKNTIGLTSTVTSE